MNIFEEKNKGIVFSLDNLSKSTILDISSAIIKNVVDGNTDPLKEYIKAKGLSELSDSITSGIKELAIDEADRYQDGDTVMGCKFQVRSLADSYDFSHNDEWMLLNAQLDSVKKQMKEIEQKMIDAMKYAEIVDDRTGEVIPPAILKKKGSKTLAITMPK